MQAIINDLIGARIIPAPIDAANPVSPAERKPKMQPIKNTTNKHLNHNFQNGIRTLT